MLGPILLRFRDITAFVRRNPLFSYPTPISAKISGCYSWSRPVMLGSAESEHLRLTDREINFEEFELMSLQSINVTDRQTTCDRKTALCTVSASRGKNRILQI